MSSFRFSTIGLILLSSRARGKEKSPALDESETKPARDRFAGRLEFGGVGKR
jgi:hypothetical protein